MPKPPATSINFPHKSTPEPNRLELLTREFADRLRHRFADEIEADPRGFKKKTLRLIRRQLPPRPGRPRDPKTDTAVELLREGKTVRHAFGNFFWSTSAV